MDYQIQLTKICFKFRKIQLLIVNFLSKYYLERKIREKRKLLYLCKIIYNISYN